MPNREETTVTETRPRRTIHLGQFRITRLQVVNWGTFCGYKDFPVDERGVLFTGPSGSGKSTLLNLIAGLDRRADQARGDL